MPRSALILSCVIHGSVLAVVGWSSLLVAPQVDDRRVAVSASLSQGESELLVTEDDPVPPIAPAAPDASFTPPAPTLEPITTSATTVESAPPSIPPLLTPSRVPPAMPSAVPTKKAHPSRAGSAPGTSGGSRGVAGGSGYMPPQFLLRYKPPYPDQARAQRLEGVVLLLVGVDAEGRVTSASIRQSCGYLVLDRAAVESVRSWRFSPARQGDHNIAATVEVPIRFKFSALGGG